MEWSSVWDTFLLTCTAHSCSWPRGHTTEVIYVLFLLDSSLSLCWALRNDRVFAPSHQDQAQGHYHHMWTNGWKMFSMHHPEAGSTERWKGKPQPAGATYSNSEFDAYVLPLASPTHSLEKSNTGPPCRSSVNQLLCKVQSLVKVSKHNKKVNCN